MLLAPRGLPLAELEKHIDGATLDLGRIAASWEKEGKKVSFENEGLEGYPMLSHVIPLALAVEGGAVPVSLECLDSGNDTLLNPFDICYGWLALALSSVFWISSGSSSLHLLLKIRMISSLWQHTPQSVSERLSKLHQSTRCVQIRSG